MVSAPSNDRGGRRTRWSLRLALLAGSLALALGLGEGFARWRAARAGTPHERQRAREELWFAANGMSADLRAGRATIGGGLGEARVMLHPYLGFDSPSGLDQIERDLRRAREPGGERDFDLVVLGGSVAAILCHEAGATLVGRLAADARLEGREVRLHMYARGAFKQPQQAILLTYLLSLGLEPDAVVNIDGYNELALNADGHGSGVHPVQPLVPYWSTLVAGASSLDAETLALRERAMALGERGRRLCRGAFALQLDRSALACLVLEALARRHRAQVVHVQEAYAARLVGREVDAELARVLHGPRERAGASAVEDCARMWGESSRSLRALCEARGVPYLHVLQPTLHDEGSKPLTDDELRSGTLVEPLRVAVRDGYPLLRERGRALEAEGEHYLDASRLFAEVSETLYYDACHFGAAGCELLARATAEGLLAALP